MIGIPRTVCWNVFAALLALVVATGGAAAQCPAPAWAAVDPAHPLNASVNAFVEWDPGGPGPQGPTLVAAGGFNLAGPTAIAPQVATWNGTSWQPLGSGITNGLVLALYVYNGTLIAGGGFTTIGGSFANHVAQWNGATSVFIGNGFSSVVFSLGEHNGELVAGGAFSVVGGSVAEHIARWNGSSWQPFGIGLSNSVYAITHFGGDLVVGQLLLHGSDEHRERRAVERFGLGLARRVERTDLRVDSVPRRADRGRRPHARSLERRDVAHPRRVHVWRQRGRHRTDDL